MLALILAGGRGSRLGMGEKPLVRLCGRPLIEYPLDVCRECGLEPVVITTPSTPYTENYCRAQGYDFVKTDGDGYVEDLVRAVLLLGAKGPIFTLCSDIPGLSREHIACIMNEYTESRRDACSVWIPEEWYLWLDLQVPYTDIREGQRVCPAGINILLGEKIQEEQSEYKIILDDPFLALNINSRQDLLIAERVFSTNPPRFP
jgi:adenosylcobinamide-phosphate guanylyltransferase